MQANTFSFASAATVKCVEYWGCFGVPLMIGRLLTAYVLKRGILYQDGVHVLYGVRALLPGQDKASTSPVRDQPCTSPAQAHVQYVYLYSYSYLLSANSPGVVILLRISL